MLNQKPSSIAAFAKQMLAQHSLIAFFVLAFGFSWILWLLIPQSNGFSTIANYGPAFAAVVLSVILIREKDTGFGLKRWVIFALAFAAGLAIWVLFDAQQYMGLGWPAGAATAAVAAFFISGLLAGHKSVRDLLGPVNPRRVGWSSYIAALFLGPAIYLAAVGLDLALGGQLPPWPRGEPTPVLILLGFGFIFLYGGGITEEEGWRGFALPRLQNRFSPLVASIIIGIFWSFWHAPLYFVGQYTPESNTGPASIAGILTRLIWVIPLAIIFTWLYNRSERSLLLSLVLHTSFNLVTALVPLSPRAGMLMACGTMWAAALIIIAAGRMWRKTQVKAAGVDGATAAGPNRSVGRQPAI